ncbi:hypothetical protein HDV00_003157 [Rhizophlyctis rosea]|nr:hypothetical protein HDV00_003157 [Rhizophlyctis rosea]
MTLQPRHTTSSRDVSPSPSPIDSSNPLRKSLSSNMFANSLILHRSPAATPPRSTSPSPLTFATQFESRHQRRMSGSSSQIHNIGLNAPSFAFQLPSGRMKSVERERGRQRGRRATTSGVVSEDNIALVGGDDGIGGGVSGSIGEFGGSRDVGLDRSGDDVVVGRKSEPAPSRVRALSLSRRQEGGGEESGGRGVLRSGSGIVGDEIERVDGLEEYGGVGVDGGSGFGRGAEVMEYLRSIAEIQKELASSMQKLQTSVSRDGQIVGDLVRSMRYRAAENATANEQGLETIQKVINKSAGQIAALESQIQQITRGVAELQGIKGWVRSRGQWLFRLIVTGIAIWAGSGLMLANLLWKARRRMLETGKSI